MSLKEPTAAARFVAEVALTYGSKLHSFLVRRLRRDEDARDIAQEVYLKLMRLERFELIRQPQAYLYFLASQVMHEQRMRQAHHPVIYDSETVEQLSQGGALAAPDDFVVSDETERELKRLLGKLSAAHRSALILRKRDGMSYKEIAKELDMSVHTVKKYLFQANVRMAAMKWKP